MIEKCKSLLPKPKSEDGSDEPVDGTTKTDADVVRIPYSAMLFVWPLLFASSVGNATASMLKWYDEIWAEMRHSSLSFPPLDWTTSNDIALELPTMQLRDFSGGRAGRPTLICAPYSLHSAIIADFAPGHSVVEALHQSGIPRVFVTDWRSATPTMRYYSIDTYLADLNVAVDETGFPVDLIGLCQGGWMALVYAARFPEKVRRLVLVGAPVDIRSAKSRLAQMAANLPFAAFEAVVEVGNGRVLGKQVSEFWGHAPHEREVDNALQEVSKLGDDRLTTLERRFDEWHARPLDLPGTYYLQVIQKIFKDNQIAEQRFVALGRRTNFANIRCPIYLLAGNEDQVVPPDQLLSTAHLVDMPGQYIEESVEPCGHLSLFLGSHVITEAWRDIARWLNRNLELASSL